MSIFLIKIEKNRTYLAELDAYNTLVALVEDIKEIGIWLDSHNDEKFTLLYKTDMYQIRKYYKNVIKYQKLPFLTLMIVFKFLLNLYNF